MKALYIFLLVALVAIGCQKNSNYRPDGTIAITGILQTQGATTYQYGTHTIGIGNNTFSLQSSTVKLDSFANKSVHITGTKVKGYPVEGGPILLDVKTITLR